MKKETLQNLLHNYFPDWDNSVKEPGKNLGFSFGFNIQQRWDWFATGKHIEVERYAEQELRNLKLPAEMAIYWICCFYSDYHTQNNVIDLTKVEGPPFLEFPCFSQTLGKTWQESIENARRKLMNNKYIKTNDELIGWFWDLEDAKELGEIALNEVKSLNLKDYYAMAWVCCFLPQGAKWMANRSLLLLEHFPQFANRRQFICSDEYSRKSVRAYPFVIDWVEGADAKYRKLQQYE